MSLGPIDCRILGEASNPDNQKAITRASRLYATSLGPDERTACIHMAIYETLKYYDSAREASFSTLLYRNLKREYGAFKKANKQERNQVELNDSMAYHDKGYDSIDLNEALDHIEPVFRRVLSLKYEKGMSIKQIAIRENLDRKSVEKIHDRAISKLKELIHE